MKCEHHPKYDPASGEPTSELAMKERFIKGNPNVLLPCPYCWQARAKWLDGQDIGSMTSMNKIAAQNKLIEELKQKLERKLEAHFSDFIKKQSEHQERIKELEADGERLDALEVLLRKRRTYIPCLRWDPYEAETLRQAIDKARKEQA